MKIADVQDDIDRVLISHERLEKRLDEVAAQISHDFAGDDNLLLIAVLKGAVNTITALSQKMSIPTPMDFMSLSSYGRGTESSGVIKVRSDLTTDVRGRDVLICEDIIDTGETLKWLTKELKKRGAKSVTIFALLSKPSRRTVDVPVEYLGFEVPDAFVVGFGLDYDEKYRNLDCIAVLKPSVYEKRDA